jgi:hypothetical protein
MIRAFLLTVFFATQASAMELPAFRTDVPDAILDVSNQGSRILRSSQEEFRAKFIDATFEMGNEPARPEHRLLKQMERENQFRPRQITEEEMSQIIWRMKIVAQDLPIKDNKSEKTPWRELFNGKDLTGWKTIGSAIWKAEDGVLVGGQFGDPKRGGLIRTEESFTDFELELEFQIDEHGKYNSGVYLRNDPNTASRTGYQVNIGRGAAGEFCGGIYTTDWLAKGDETDTVRKPKEWNALRILAKGAHIQVELNGKKIVDMVDPKPDPKFLQKGVIGFQTYGAEGHDGWVKFRAIRLRKLMK